MWFIFKLEWVVANSLSLSRSYESSSDVVVIILLLYFPFSNHLKVTIPNNVHMRWLLALLEHEMVQVQILHIECLNNLAQLILSLRLQKRKLRKELYLFLHVLKFDLFQHFGVLIFFENSEVAICQAHNRGFSGLVIDQS